MAVAPFPRSARSHFASPIGQSVAFGRSRFRRCYGFPPTGARNFRYAKIKGRSKPMSALNSPWPRRCPVKSEEKANSESVVTTVGGGVLASQKNRAAGAANPPRRWWSGSAGQTRAVAHRPPLPVQDQWRTLRRFLFAFEGNLCIIKFTPTKKKCNPARRERFGTRRNVA